MNLAICTLLALMTFGLSQPIARTFSVNAASATCAPHSICGWIKLGRTSLTSPQVPQCYNVFENRNRRDIANGIGNPNLDFPAPVLVGGAYPETSYEIWGRWVNPTDQPQILGGGRLFVSCTAGN